METLGSPSISRAPMGVGHAFRKLVYAGNRYNDIHYRSLPEIHFTASGFSLKTFDCLCVFVFVSFFFFASLHITKSRKNKTKKEKKEKQNNNLHNLHTGRTNTLLCQSFSLYHVKRAYSLCVTYSFLSLGRRLMSDPLCSLDRRSIAAHSFIKKYGPHTRMEKSYTVHSSSCVKRFIDNTITFFRGD